jgi:hypothetical protein
VYRRSFRLGLFSRNFPGPIVIEHALKSELGEVQLDFDPQGVTCVMERTPISPLCVDLEMFEQIAPLSPRRLATAL